MSAASASMKAGAAGGHAGPGSSGSVQKRLQQELMQLMMSGNKEVTAFPEGDNVFSWAGVIRGTPGTVYEGCSFKIAIKFPADYPFAPPTITFVTPCWHPNVDASGGICLDILKDKWTAAYSTLTVLLSLQTLLGDPNNDSPLNGAAAQLWADAVEFRKTVVRRYRADTGAAPTAGPLLDA